MYIYTNLHVNESCPINNTHTSVCWVLLSLQVQRRAQVLSEVGRQAPAPAVQMDPSGTWLRVNPAHPNSNRASHPPPSLAPTKLISTKHTTLLPTNANTTTPYTHRMWLGSNPCRHLARHRSRLASLWCNRRSMVFRQVSNTCWARSSGRATTLRCTRANYQVARAWR